MRTIALARAALMLSATLLHGTAGAKELVLARCDSPFIAKVWSSPWLGSPAEDAWAAIALDQVAGECGGVVAGTLDVFMARQARNEVMGATLPAPADVGEAIDAERRLEEQASMTAPEFYNLLHTRSFRLALRQQDTSSVRLAFTNVATWSILWPRTVLVLRDPETGYLLLELKCEAPKPARRLEPGATLVTSCRAPGSLGDWQVQAALRDLGNRDRWTLRDEEWPFRHFYDEVASLAARERAALLLASSTCGDRFSCEQEQNNRGGPPSLLFQMWPFSLGGFALGAGLYLLMRPRGRRSPSVLLAMIVAVASLAALVAGFGSGLGGLALLGMIVVGGLGVIAGAMLAFALPPPRRSD